MMVIVYPSFLGLGLCLGLEAECRDVWVIGGLGWVVISASF